MSLPCKVVVLDIDNPTQQNLDEVVQAIKEALAVPEDVHQARWDKYFEESGRVNPRNDPTGKLRKAQFDRDLAELNAKHGW